MKFNGEGENVNAIFAQSPIYEADYKKVLLREFRAKIGEIVNIRRQENLKLNTPRKGDIFS